MFCQIRNKTPLLTLSESAKTGCGERGLLATNADVSQSAF